CSCAYQAHYPKPASALHRLLNRRWFDRYLFSTSSRGSLSLSAGGREMTNLRPRKVAHKGRVEAAGFLFDTDLIGVAEARRRILNLWDSGVQVYTDGPNLFVRLSSRIRVDSANSVATPLVQIEDVLSALPLSPDEFELLQAPSHSVV